MHIELYQLTRLQTLAEGAMIGYTEKGMQMAQDVLVGIIASSSTSLQCDLYDLFKDFKFNFVYVGKDE